MDDSFQVLATARDWLGGAGGVAIATVIATWGSSPRPVGSLLCVDGRGRFAGSVSGGCIESAVIREALTVIRDGGFRVLDFGVSDGEAWAAGLACGGRLRILIERLD